MRTFLHCGRSTLGALCATSALVLASLPCVAAGSPWDGTWKLNQSKSQMNGATHTVEQHGNVYAVHEGPTNYEFTCDGKEFSGPYPETAGTCTQQGRVFHMVYKLRGKTMATVDRTFTPDSKSYTTVTTDFRPDGTEAHGQSTFLRIGDGEGMAGTWKRVSTSLTTADEFKLKVTPTKVQYVFPAWKQVCTNQLDGTPAACTGADVVPGMATSVKTTGPRSMSDTFLIKGQPASYDTVQLSDDGRTLTLRTWEVGKEAEKQIYVYERQ